MRTSHACIAALAAWMLLCAPARAACNQMMEVIRLADISFSEGAVQNPAVLQKLNLTIADLNNDALLNALKASGQSSAFGDLRNFLTLLRFITQSRDDNPFRFTPEMQADLIASREVVQTACASTEGATEQQGSASDQSTAGSLPGGSGTDGIGATLSSPVRGKLTNEQQAFLQRNFQLDLLAKLFGGIAAAILLVIAVHYAMLWTKVIRRNRRICQVPATLECMMISLPGHISVLGHYGCTFVVDGEIPKALNDLTSGAYCSLSVGGRTMGAKLMRDLGPTCGMLFTTPLSRHLNREILDQSEVPVRFDFSVTGGLTGNPRLFGRGALPTAPPLKRRKTVRPAAALPADQRAVRPE